jgi:exodeoxyribonuclease V gamma subunit
LSSTSVTSAVHVYRSNRTELLADGLTELLSEPSGGPFEAETIVVQGRGMAVWLSQRLSLRHRVVANTDFTYPRQLVMRAFRAVLGEDAVREAAVSEEGLLWSVLAALPPLFSQPEFVRVARYLADDAKGVRRFQLADRIATRFDQYLTYRPDMVRAWSLGEDGGVGPEDAWQPLLFRALGGTVPTRNLAALEDQYRGALRRGKSPEGLPLRIALFGLSSLPPLFLRVIAALAPHVDLHLFTFSPSPKDFWNHSRREDLVRALEGGADPKDLHLDVGSPLLASMGALGAEFETVLEQGLAEVGVFRTDEDRFVPPDAPGMLGAIQRTIYDLSPGPTESRERTPLPEGDASISVHSCHGPMREVEVLHDQLLDLLTREGSTLEPRDVVVMTPDVDAYAPFIEAVFDRARGKQYIPYRISDRSVRTDCPAIDAFQRILGLVGGRAEASLVLDLLNLAPVQEKFDIDPNELEQITEWVVESGVRWGIDEEHRALHGQPKERQNTWRFGLDRLLLGYAMKARGRSTFEGVLPFEEIEGKGAELLGSLAEFADRLFEVLRNLEGQRPLAAWRRDLGAALSTLIASDSRTAWQHRVITLALDEIVENARALGFEEAVDLDVVRKLLDRRIDTSYPERGFLSSGVTFCAMLPMRSIPFRAVCLLGMNDGAYPRSGRPVDFDLIRKGGSRPGDRDRRKDDRYLFLEALMAARETFLITYTGQSIRDNAKRPPSVVVNELLDGVERLYGTNETETETETEAETARLEKLRERLVVRHPLQGFSRRNFDGKDPRLFSFVEAYRSGAVHAGCQRTPSPPFFEAPLPSPDEDADRTILLPELARFYEDPVGYLLTRRLGVYLKDTGVDIPDREPVEVVELERWKLGDALLEESLDGMESAMTEELARARGELPLGRYGTLVHAEVDEIVREIAERVREARAYGRSPPVSVNRVLSDGTRLVGELGDWWGGGLLRHQFSRIRAKYQLSLWVRHVVLCWAARPDACSVLVGQHESGKNLAATVTFAPMSEPEAYLVKLVGFYRAGLSAPLRYTPVSSLKYAEALHTGKTQDAALADARKAYGDRENGERSYAPHLERVFGTEKPGFENVLAAVGDFGELAREIVLPMLHRRTVS